MSTENVFPVDLISTDYPLLIHPVYIKIIKF